MQKYVSGNSDELSTLRLFDENLKHDKRGKLQNLFRICQPGYLIKKGRTLCASPKTLLS